MLSSTGEKVDYFPMSHKCAQEFMNTAEREGLGRESH
jgi:hypothetical protein